tara:strand:+ start:315 stop:785 length:471 start_codon:yes stop_codon:yes gene_type:complete
MTEIFAGSLAVILSILLWGLGKKPLKTINRASQENLLVSSNQTKTTLVTKISHQSILLKQQEPEWQTPKNERERYHLRSKLFLLISSGPEERLQAVNIASKWGNASVLSILKIGLKDSDSRVVFAAAEGIKKFKKVPIIKKSQSTERPPLNVFLMR